MYFVHVYIFKKFQKKKSNQIKSNEKVFGLGALGLLSHLKKIKTFELGSLNFLVTFSKRPNFLFLSRKKEKKRRSLIFKMVHEDPLDKTFSKS